jgi:uncharacterized protein YndB with AHSA1/START domain
MPVNKDRDGRRWVEAQCEVPGTPEEVWRAIATGPGISSWFVPSQVDEREGGAVICDFGPGMLSQSTITVWDPPRRMAADSRDDMGPGDPTIASEWTVEARAGGTCIVRVVHSWFTDKDDWDEQYEGTTHGWRSFFRILRLYLAHFQGQPCTPLQCIVFAPGSKEEVWSRIFDALDLGEPKLGGRLQSTAGAPPLAGEVVHAGVSAYPEELLLKLDRPCSGAAHLFAMQMGGMICAPIRIYLYGDEAPGAAAAAEKAWESWLAEHFPPPGSGAKA